MQACIANKVLGKMKISFVFVALIGLTFNVLPQRNSIGYNIMKQRIRVFLNLPSTMMPGLL